MTNVKKFIEIWKKLWFILSKSEKKKSVHVFFCITLSSILELLSVSAVLPFVYALLDPGAFLGNKMLLRIISIPQMREFSAYQLSYLVGILIMIVYIVRGIVLVRANYVRIEFENTIMKSMCDQMLECYMCRPYEDATDVTSAEAVRGINVSATSVYYILQSFFLLILNIFSTILISIFLILIDVKMTLELTIISGVFIISILVITKKKVRRSGAEFNESALFANQYTTELINGLKEITVQRKHKFFLDKFKNVTYNKKIAEQKYRFLQYYPNVLIQSIIVCNIIFVACISLKQGADSGVTLSNLAAFGFGAMKIIPGVSMISACLTTILYYYDSFNDAYVNIARGREYEMNRSQILNESTKDVDKLPIVFDELNVKNLSWQYKGRTVRVLDRLDLKIKKGECIGIVGKSGAGKSTLADILLGLLKPTIEGSVLADNIDIYSEPRRWSHTVGYVPQFIFLMNDTIRNNILFGEENTEENEKKIWDALAQAQIIDYIKSLPNGIDTEIGEGGSKLSGGQRQRIVIARALFNNPSLLILDEATSSLDNETENAVMESINYLHGKKTMVIIAHRLSTIRNCDRVYEIVEGKAILKNE